MTKKLLISLLLCSVAFGQSWNFPGQKPWLGKQINWGHPLSKGIIGMWLFTDNPGVTGKTYDLSGNGNDGTLAGTSQSVPGKYGNAIDFDGDSDYIDLGNPDALKPDLITISVWINPDAWGNDGSIIRWDLHINHGWDLDIDNGDEFRWYVGNGTTYASNSSTIAPYGLNTWIHVVVVMDGSYAKTYVNGIETDSDALAGTISYTLCDDLYIGAEPGPADYYNGQIDHIIIWNRGLTASEVGQLYQGSFCMFEEVFPVWWYGGIGAPAAGGQVIIIY